MPDIVPQDVHIDVALTEMSVAYIQDQNNFIAGTIFPIVPVTKQTNKYFVYPKGSFFRTDMSPRPLGDSPNRSSYTTSTDSYGCEEYGEEQVIDDRQRENTDNPLEPDRDATIKLTQSGLIYTDQSWAGKFFNNSTWTVNQAGVASAPGANQFIRFDQAGADPVKTIRNAIRTMQRTTGFKPNVLVLGVDVYEVLINTPSIYGRIQYIREATEAGGTDEFLLGRLFGVAKVVVAESVAMTSPEGVTDTIDFIMNSKSFLLCYAAPNPSLLTPSAGYIFSWSKLGGVVTPNSASVIRRGRIDRAKSDWLQIGMAWDMKVVAPDLGIYFSAAVT